MDKKLRTGWLWFYTYVRTPLSIFFLFGALYDLDRSPEKFDKQFLLVMQIVCVGFMILYLCNLIGLAARTLWGWNLNWWVLIAEGLVFPFSGRIPCPDFLSYLLLLGTWGVLWFLPNAIYFSKRECLFS